MAEGSAISPSAEAEDASPALSVVIAVLNERENIAAVCQELATVRRDFPLSEIIFVDDGSTDGTIEAIVAARKIDGLGDIRILSHDRRCGKSSALRTGIRSARGRWIATMDGDGQDDPSAIVALYAEAGAAKGRPPLVVGVRPRRSDTIWRKLATRFANGLRKRLLNDGCPDTGAPMKLFLRSDFLALPQFEGLHRFLPALLQSYGVSLVCVPVRHRSRLHGQSKYSNLGRAVVGVRDLLGVIWLRNRTRLPVSVREC
ncbi:glycosyltransferase family 2 protein [Acetobacter nitrogenifigens]|uniref:Dolichol-phosphate mannosyltransferase n=1 Tax=Acetobacter nitrogenifigens DSM 23921 = NBRC 105050 TaxID=1120919 RepID=A0A511X877_9PROT|nr:glycosyltransferase family 2 protein [Acetobacter nitrogenifigens]GEN59142.1 dolichol-phosphate mannosyltransferase [Acetobacter nitrogenifigens DSM 23921 = NBRC 105050]